MSREGKPSDGDVVWRPWSDALGRLVRGRIDYRAMDGTVRTARIGEGAVHAVDGADGFTLNHETRPANMGQSIPASAPSFICTTGPLQQEPVYQVDTMQLIRQAMATGLLSEEEGRRLLAKSLGLRPGEPVLLPEEPAAPAEPASKRGIKLTGDLP